MLKSSSESEFVGCGQKCKEKKMLPQEQFYSGVRVFIIIIFQGSKQKVRQEEIFLHKQLSHTERNN